MEESANQNNRMTQEDLTASAPSSLWKDAWKRFYKNKTAVVALVVLALLALGAVFAEWLTPYNPYEVVLSEVKQAPSLAHPMGCDEQGRDILTRLLFGARISLSVGFISVSISTLLGSIIGIFSAYYGGWVDAILSRIMEMIQSFPSILLAIIFMSVFGRGIQNAIIAIAVVSIPGPARIIRSSTLSAKEMDYVTSARAIGCTNVRIMFKHILPNILAPIIVNATMSVSGAILSLASLGFLGLGVQPPTAEWGYMLSDSRTYINSAPHMIMFPGATSLII